MVSRQLVPATIARLGVGDVRGSEPTNFRLHRELRSLSAGGSALEPPEPSHYCHQWRHFSGSSRSHPGAVQVASHAACGSGAPAPARYLKSVQAIL